MTPLEAAERALAADCEHDDPAIWITGLADEAVFSRARTLQAEGRQGRKLWGVPFAVKDRTWTSPACRPRPLVPAMPTPRQEPRPRCSGCDEGALLIGKTSLDQFATGLVGTRSPHGVPRNVFDAGYVPGGSSSGSAPSRQALSVALGPTPQDPAVPAAFGNIVD